MATKKRGKARPAGRRSTKPARKRAAKAATARGAARPKARGAKKSAARPAAASASREVAALRREKRALEKQLTDTVREIGQLRHHEMRAAQLERQLKERDDVIVQLRSQLSERRTREYVPPDDDVQPSLALGSRSTHDLHDLDDDLAPEDEDDELM